MQSIALRRIGAPGALALLLWAAAPEVLAQQNASPAAPAATPPAYQLGHAPARAIRVDGKLDEDAWRAAPAIDHFSENLPLSRSTSRHRTELRMLVSGHDLHVGMKSYDDDPDAIRAPLVRRDGVLGDQDFFALYLDSVGTRTFGQFFRINARGVLSDGSWNDQIGSEDFSPDF